MSRSLGNVLPAPLLPLFDGERLREKSSLAFLLATVDARGFPHCALLSAGEIVARAPGALRLALYGSSTTTANLRRSGTGTLALAQGGLAYYVKLQATERPASGEALRGLAVFDGVIVEVLEDGDPTARVAGGFAIALARDAERTVARWERVVVALRALD
jgi:hypothetical protein